MVAFQGGKKMKTLATVSLVMVGLLSGCRTTAPRVASTVAAGRNGATTPAQAPMAFKAFPIYTDRAPRHTHYVPSGYMGDSDLIMSGSYTDTPDGQGPSLKVIYKASGPKGWAGLYWQDPANNWGDVPGKAGYDLRGAKRLTFWAKGENGGERVHEFRMGGIVGQYPDSAVASITNIRLSKEWKQYTIDLSNQDLRHVIAGFGFFLNKAENPGGMSFYLDDIAYEGEGTEGSFKKMFATNASTASLTGQSTTAPPPPAPPVVPLAASAVPASAKDLVVKDVPAGLRVSFSSQLLFATGEANLGPGSRRVLDQLVLLLQNYPANNVLIEGHTDKTGDPNYNLKLSQLRGENVRDFLIKEGGFANERFKVTGYGDTKPVADNRTKTGRSLNRRVEVTILKIGKP